MNTLLSFADTLAGAGAAEEARLIGEAGALFGIGAGPTDGAVDRAIRLHRALLPTNGYQLGETRPGVGLASSFTARDAFARPFEATTPALALLRAAIHARAFEDRAAMRRACTVCDGRGWIILRDGAKRLCRHGASGAAP